MPTGSPLTVTPRESIDLLLRSTDDDDPNPPSPTSPTSDINTTPAVLRPPVPPPLATLRLLDPLRRKGRCCVAPRWCW